MTYATQVAADLNNKGIYSFIATWSSGYSGNPGNNLRDKKSTLFGFAQKSDLIQMCVDGENLKQRNDTFIQSLIQKQEQWNFGFRVSGIRCQNLIHSA